MLYQYGLLEETQTVGETLCSGTVKLTTIKCVANLTGEYSASGIAYMFGGGSVWSQDFSTDFGPGYTNSVFAVGNIVAGNSVSVGGSVKLTNFASVATATNNPVFALTSAATLTSIQAVGTAVKYTNASAVATLGNFQGFGVSGNVFLANATVTLTSIHVPTGGNQTTQNDTFFSGSGTISLSAAGVVAIPLGGTAKVKIADVKAAGVFGQEAFTTSTSNINFFCNGQAQQAGSVSGTINFLTMTAQGYVNLTAKAAVPIVTFQAIGTTELYTNCSSVSTLTLAKAVGVAFLGNPCLASVNLPDIRAVATAFRDSTGVANIPTLRAVVVTGQEDFASGLSYIGDFYGAITANQSQAASATASIPSLAANSQVFIPGNVNANGAATLGLSSSGFAISTTLPVSATVNLPSLEVQNIIVGKELLNTGLATLSAMTCSGIMLNSRFMSGVATIGSINASVTLGKELIAQGVGSLGTVSTSGTALWGALVGVGTITFAAVAQAQQVVSASAIVNIPTLTASVTTFNELLAHAAITFIGIQAQGTVGQDNFVNVTATIPTLRAVSVSSTPVAASGIASINLRAVASMQSYQTCSGLAEIDFNFHGQAYLIDTKIESENVIYFKE